MKKAEKAGISKERDAVGVSDAEPKKRLSRGETGRALPGAFPGLGLWRLRWRRVQDQKGGRKEGVVNAVGARNYRSDCGWLFIRFSSCEEMVRALEAQQEGAMAEMTKAEEDEPKVEKQLREKTGRRRRHQKTLHRNAKGEDEGNMRRSWRSTTQRLIEILRLFSTDAL